jgi:hypothetical protein
MTLYSQANAERLQILIILKSTIKIRKIATVASTKLSHPHMAATPKK